MKRDSLNFWLKLAFIGNTIDFIKNATISQFEHHYTRLECHQSSTKLGQDPISSTLN